MIIRRGQTKPSKEGPLRNLISERDEKKHSGKTGICRDANLPESIKEISCSTAAADTIH